MNEMAKATATRSRALRRAFGSLVLGLVLTAAAVAPTSAASPGDWTGWTLNPGSGCSIRTQTPYLTGGQVQAKAQVWCPSDAWLTVRERIRSNRTLQDDVTVATAACWVNSTCPVLHRGQLYYTYTATCARTNGTVTHGYHSDILIYPGTQSFYLTSIKSGNATLSPHCRA